MNGGINGLSTGWGEPPPTSVGRTLTMYQSVLCFMQEVDLGYQQEVVEVINIFVRGKSKIGHGGESLWVRDGNRSYVSHPLYETLGYSAVHVATFNLLQGIYFQLFWHVHVLLPDTPF